jgi:hypothetical protein
MIENMVPGTELNRRRQPFQGCALPDNIPIGAHIPHIVSAKALKKKIFGLIRC